MNDSYIHRLRDFFINNSIIPDDLTRLKQLVGLELFDGFSEICRVNNLEYWATGGTLLGAIRHSGFIPWDDDMDFGMRRSDIDKLKKLVEGTEYSLTGYYYRRIHLFKFRFVEGSGFIDIFPFDEINYYGDEVDLRRLYSDLYTMKNSILDNDFLDSKDSKEIRRTHEYLSMLPSLLRGDRRFYSLGLDSMIPISKRIVAIPICKIFPLKKMKFLNRTIYIPNDVEFYLNSNYSQYRVPVRFGQHGGSGLSDLIKTCKLKKIDMGVFNTSTDMTSAYNTMMSKLVDFLIKEEDYRSRLDLAYMYRQGLGCEVDLDKAKSYARQAYEMEVNDKTITMYSDLLELTGDRTLNQKILFSNADSPEVTIRKINHLTQFNSASTEEIIDLYNTIVGYNREWELDLIRFEIKTNIGIHVQDAYNRCLNLSKIGWKRA